MESLWGSGSGARSGTGFGPALGRCSVQREARRRDPSRPARPEHDRGRDERSRPHVPRLRHDRRARRVVLWRSPRLGFGVVVRGQRGSVRSERADLQAGLADGRSARGR